MISLMAEAAVLNALASPVKCHECNSTTRHDRIHDHSKMFNISEQAV